MFKNLKSLFIEEVKDNKGKANPQQTTRKQETRSTPTPPRPTTSSASVIVPESQTGEAGKVTNKFMDVLFAAMEKNNIDGFDYLEFKKSLQSLSKMPMDEATRFKSAYAMAQTMGVTPQRLVETANFYLNILNKEEKKFEQALHSQRSQQIGNKEQQIKQLDETVKKKAEQIKRLTQEIEMHQKQSEQLKSDIKQKTVRIETTKNNFIASYNALVAQIEKDVDNMKIYLK